MMISDLFYAGKDFWNKNRIHKSSFPIPQQLLIKPKRRLKTFKANPLIYSMKTNRVYHGTEFDDVGRYISEMP
jgi:hypothetical protein